MTRVPTLFEMIIISYLIKNYHKKTSTKQRTYPAAWFSIWVTLTVPSIFHDYAGVPALLKSHVKKSNKIKKLD